MSNTSIKFALTAVVVAASLAAAFARHGGSISSSGVGKCRQGNPATAAAHNPAEFVHSGGVCWAPQNITDGPGA